MQATTIPPTNYRQQATLDLSKSKRAIIGAIVLGIVLLIVVGWLLVQFTHSLRPTALEGIRFRDILTTTPDGQPSIVLPVVDAVVAFALVMLIHELVHGVFFWWFAGQRPTFGVKGVYVYAAAPPQIYFPRNQHIVVGIAPLVLLTLVGLLLVVILPLVAADTLIEDSIAAGFRFGPCFPLLGDCFARVWLNLDPLGGLFVIRAEG